MLQRLLPALLFMLCAPAAVAQSIALDVTELDVTRFPTVQAKVEIRRNGMLLRAFAPSDFRVQENGIEQRVESITCPGDSTTRLSIGILIDRSGSMALLGPYQPDPDSAKLRAAKRAVSTFLGYLDARDEAALYSFSTSLVTPDLQTIIPFFSVEQDFTRDTAQLRRALVPIVAYGGTWLWRSSVSAINHLAPRPGRRVLIVLTDGESQREYTWYPSTVIAAAQKQGIPVYTIGLGASINASELLSIANATGGRFIASPDETMLEQVFTTLAREIITDACVLRYIARDGCLDGSDRRVDVQLMADSRYAEDTASYSLPLALSPITLALPGVMDVPSRTDITVPVMLVETLTLSPLTWRLSLRFDPALLRFAGLRQQGTIAEGAMVTIDHATPGELRLSTIPYLPVRAGGTLVEVEFHTAGGSDTSTTLLSLTDVAVLQQCPTTVTATGARIRLLPCETHYDLRPAPAYVARAGDVLHLPLVLTPSLPAGTQCTLDVTLAWNPDDLVFVDLVTDGSLAAQLPPDIVRTADAARFTFSGVTVASTGTLVTVRFRSVARDEARIAHITLVPSTFTTECITTVAAVGGAIPIDGICERVVARRTSEQYVRNHPSPFHRSTVITFGLVRAGDARVSIHDATGREVAVLADGMRAEGTWRVTFDAGGLPAGVYHVVLAGPDGRTLQPILLVK